MTVVERSSLPKAQLRARSGAILPVPGRRWVERADDTDEQVLRLAVSPVLDLGCGPGRHAEALVEMGATVLGIDACAPAVETARRKRVQVLQQSLFDEIPNAGQWATALLLDGNIGIGGDPVRLLSHVATLLRPGGRALVEVEKPGNSNSTRQVRLEIDDMPGPWFSWTSVQANSLAGITGDAGMSVRDAWRVNDRYFAILDTPFLP